jgi:predicted permease
MGLKTLRALFLRVLSLLGKGPRDRELREELESHVQMHIDDNLRAGMSAEQARRVALIKLGGVEQVKESVRDRRGIPFLETLFQDLRFGIRMLRKSPGFTVAAVLTLGLGIGANTAIFHLIDAVRLRSLPVSKPQDLVLVQLKGGNRGFGVNAGNETFLTYPLWEQIRDHQKSLSGVFAWDSWDFTVGHGSQAKSVTGLWVSGEMFSTLGVVPARGRLLSPEDDRPGCGAPGVALSYAFWQSEFGGKDSAIGSKLLVDDHPVEIVGITPQSFTGLEVGKTFDIALPFCADADPNPAENNLLRRDYFWVIVMGRLKPDATLAHAAAELDSLSPGFIEATVPTGYSNEALKTYKNYRLTAYSGGNGISRMGETYAESLWLLLSITGLVLLIACVNIANLMLARASVREREMAVRLALGASYWRLARQLLAESLLLAGGGAILGVGFAGFFSRSLVQLLSTENDRFHLDLSLDWRVLAFVAVVAILTSVIFGLAPAVRSSRMEPGDALKSAGRGRTGGRESHSFQRLLVVSQIAVSLVLLVGALLFVHSFWNLTKVDPGFRQDGILIASLDLGKLHLSPERYESTRRELLVQIRSIPLVESAATSTHLPFFGSWTSAIAVEGNEGPSKFSWVSPGYLQTLQIPLIEGRDFNDRDTSTSPRVAIVSQSFVRKYLAGRDPIGKVIHTSPEPRYPAANYEIVGVVKDTKYADLWEESPPAESYAPASQFPAGGSWAAVLIRSSSPLAAVTAATREEVAAVSPDISMDFRVLKSHINDGLVRERMLALLSGSFGLLAVLLAMIGLYGVISYIVTLRRAEIGIRIALGASRQNIVAVVLKQTMVLLALGIAVGTVFALVAARGAGSLLFGIQPADPFTMVGGSVLLACVALAASFIPARRATRVDPMIALRYE